jgi:uncharacterized protein (DUF433 family)
MRTARYPHIKTTSKGPRIAGTRIEVSTLAIAHIVHGWSALEIQREFPTLTLGQIHSALAYYFDQRDELNRSVAEADAQVGHVLEKLESLAPRERLARQESEGQQILKFRAR